MNKKVIVSGVTGMDGSLMSKYLLSNTDYLIMGGIRRLSVPNHQNISDIVDNPRFKLVPFDLSDPHCVESLIFSEKPDYFINFAANSFVGNSWDMPAQHFTVNSLGVLHILEAIRKHSPLTRIYNAGSSEEWGNVDYTPQDIKHPMKPRSPYGAAKCAAHLLMKVYRESYGLYCVQGVLTNHEGVARGEEFVTRKITKGVARIYHAIKNGLKFDPIQLGNLDSKRDWSDAEDFMDGIWRMLNQENYREDLKIKMDKWCKDNPYIPGFLQLEHYDKTCQDEIVIPNLKEYVLSSQECHSVHEFVELAFDTANIDGLWVGSEENKKYRLYRNCDDKRPPYDLGEALVEVNPKFYRPAEVDLLMGDSSPARQELGWLPKTSFPQLVKKMVKHDINLYP